MRCGHESRLGPNSTLLTTIFPLYNSGKVYCQCEGLSLQANTSTGSFTFTSYYQYDELCKVTLVQCPIIVSPYK